MMIKEHRESVIKAIKHKVQTEKSASVIDALSDLKRAQLEIDYNFDLRIDQAIIESISTEIIQNRRYVREKNGKDYFIYKRNRFKSLIEAYPLGYDAIKAGLTAGFSLLVGWLLLLSRHQAQDLKYEELKEQVRAGKKTIDSLKRLPIFQDTAKTR